MTRMIFHAAAWRARRLFDALGSMRSHGEGQEDAALPLHDGATACTTAGTTRSCQPSGMVGTAAAAASAETVAGGGLPVVGSACAAGDAGAAGSPAHGASVAGCSAKNVGVVDSPVDAAQLHDLMHALVQLARRGEARGEYGWLAALEESLVSAGAGAAPREKAPRTPSDEAPSAETSPASERSSQRQAQRGHTDNVDLLLPHGVAACKAGEARPPDSADLLPGGAVDVLAARALAAGLEADGMAERASSPWDSESAAVDAASDRWTATAPLRHRRSFQAVS
eukprot:363932-Chlamydomonas_euryale.AAC.13